VCEREEERDRQQRDRGTRERERERERQTDIKSVFKFLEFDIFTIFNNKYSLSFQIHYPMTSQIYVKVGSFKTSLKSFGFGIQIRLPNVTQIKTNQIVFHFRNN